MLVEATCLGRQGDMEFLRRWTTNEELDLSKVTLYENPMLLLNTLRNARAAAIPPMAATEAADRGGGSAYELNTNRSRVDPYFLTAAVNGCSDRVLLPSGGFGTAALQ